MKHFFNEGLFPNSRHEVEDFPSDQVEKGIEVEMEHTDNPDIALKIALDHLTEHPYYYDYLEDMEERMREDG